MTSGEALHQLIKSLTSSEKRTFTIQSTTHAGDKNYLVLFDILEKMEPYSEESLLQALYEKNLHFNLSGVQNYLQQKIMDVLCSLYEQDLTDARINKYLLEAQILEKRGFFTLCNEILDKAERLASKYHKHYHLIEILRRKGNLVISLSTKDTAQKIEHTFTKALNITKTFQEQLNYEFIGKWMFCQTAVKRYHTNEATNARIQEVVNAQLINSSPNKNSFYIQFYYYKSWALYHYIQQDSSKTRDSYLKIMEIWEHFPEMQKEEQRNYIANLSNFISALIVAKEFDLANKYILKLDEIESTNFEEDAFLFQNISLSKLLYFLNLHEYKKSSELIPELEYKLQLYESVIKQSRLLAIYYNVAIAYFLSFKYEPALDWLEKIMSITRTDETRKDIQRFARILQLVIYYQLGYQELLENLIRNVYRSKVIKEDLQPFDKLIFKYFKRLQKYAPSSKEAKSEFILLKDKLIALDEGQRLLTGYEDFKAWLDLLLQQKAAH